MTPAPASPAETVDHEAAITVALNWSPQEQIKYGRAMDYGLKNLCRAYLELHTRATASEAENKELSERAVRSLRRAEAASASRAAMREALQMAKTCLLVVPDLPPFVMWQIDDALSAGAQPGEHGK